MHAHFFVVVRDCSRMTTYKVPGGVTKEPIITSLIDTNCQAQARLRHSGSLRLSQAQSGSNSGSVTQAQ